MDYQFVHRHAALTQATTCALAHFWSNLKQLSL
jgi:hypothetical protein